jgi:hypothetical protein
MNSKENSFNSNQVGVKNLNSPSNTSTNRPIKGGKLKNTSEELHSPKQGVIGASQNKIIFKHMQKAKSKRTSEINLDFLDPSLTQENPQMPQNNKLIPPASVKHINDQGGIKKYIKTNTLHGDKFTKLINPLSHFNNLSSSLTSSGLKSTLSPNTKTHFSHFKAGKQGNYSHGGSITEGPLAKENTSVKKVKTIQLLESPKISQLISHNRNYIPINFKLNHPKSTKNSFYNHPQTKTSSKKTNYENMIVKTVEKLEKLQNKEVGGGFNNSLINSGCSSPIVKSKYSSNRVNSGEKSNSSVSASVSFLTVSQFLKKYEMILSKSEVEELKFQSSSCEIKEIYFCGEIQKRTLKNISSNSSCLQLRDLQQQNSDTILQTEPSSHQIEDIKYDDENGNYLFQIGDHINYRYEVISELGRGSFGQALKCFDHKLKERVAVKIIKNKKKFKNQAQIEIRILDYIKNMDKEKGDSNVVQILDTFNFRNHIVYYIIKNSVLLLSFLMSTFMN